MRLSKSALEKIKEFEGCRLTAYRDAVNIPTIGYGRTSGVHMGMTITQEEADHDLEQYIEAEEEALNRFFGDVKLTDNQWDAIVSFAYNIGMGNFKRSTLAKKIISNPNNPTIYNEFGRWIKAGNKKLPGLVRRRAWEAARWMGAA